MEGKPRIYLDTSVISALFDERNPERMNLTRDFMAASGTFDVCISEITTAELERTPDPIIREKMKKAIACFIKLSAAEGTAELANEYLRRGAIPESHPEDAYHIAVAVINGIDYLLSWNFKHIVRLKTRDIVQAVNKSKGFPEINILTPGELLWMIGMAKLSKAEMKKIGAAVRREFPDDPALQQVHIARRILSREAQLEGMTFLDYVRKVNSEKGRAN